MIAAVEGSVELAGERFLVISAGGVAYRIFASAETIRKIPEKGGKIKLWTHLYQREDTIELYGFLTFPELEFFELLIGVPGIGPKSGLSVLSITSLDTLKKAIAAGDTSYLTRVSGIGRKTAEKIILELREKMAGKGVGAVEAPELREEADALDALLALGYSQSEARVALAGTPKGIECASELVREALRRLGTGKRS
jgi:Holliday junction DNA helicase RuvA